MNVEKLNQKAENADDPTPEKRQDFDESAKRKSPDKKNQDSIDDEKEKKNGKEEQKDREKKSMDERIQDCQKRAGLRVSAYRRQLEDIDARNKKLDEQAKSASERTDFIANITKSALMPGTINTDETPVKPRASEQSAATAAEKPADWTAAKEKNDAREKQAAAREQPAIAVAGQDGGAKQAAA